MAEQARARRLADEEGRRLRKRPRPTTAPARSDYRQLATRPLVNWALVAVGARLPVAMTPLALVFVVRERPGGYALGAGLARGWLAAVRLG